MKEFKFFKKNEESSNVMFEPQTGILTRYATTLVNNNFYTTLTINPNVGLTTIDTTNTMKDFCFRFNDHDPVVIASSVDPLTITLTGNQSNISFTDNNTNNTFTLFSRPSENI